MDAGSGWLTSLLGDPPSFSDGDTSLSNLGGDRDL